MNRKFSVLISSFLILTMMLSCNKNQIDEGYIEVAGGKVYFKAFGLDKKNIPLIIVHGGPGVPHNYLLGLKELSDERPIIFYDQLGCGKSDKPNTMDYLQVNRFLDELKTIIDYFEFEKYNLLGQSWGSYLVTDYLLHYQPVGVRKVILAAPFLSSEKWKEDIRALVNELPDETRKIIEIHEASGNFQAQAYQNAMMEFYQKHVCNLNPWPKNLMESMENMNHEVYQYMWGPSEFTITGILLNADITPMLQDLQYETLITIGEFDEVKISTAQFYQERLPMAKLVVFSGATHSHHIEQEDKFLQTIRNFLNN